VVRLHLNWLSDVGQAARLGVIARESVMDVPDLADLAKLREEYQDSGLARSDLPANPIELWRRWLAEAEAAGVVEINAMIVATVDQDGMPSVRTVLCKAGDDRGFVFYTNYMSRKGVALSAEPRVSLLFPWHQLSRQVIVNGTSEPTSREESEAYFATRPRGAQISAWASEQSQPVASRAELEQRHREVEAKYDGGDVRCPPHWGGYVVRPRTIEFWQGRNDRLHDRLRYVARAGERAAWDIERLCP
jgi:pyridoxamine 5'-phosphate oxidase